MCIYDNQKIFERKQNHDFMQMIGPLETEDYKCTFLEEFHSLASKAERENAWRNRIYKRQDDI